MTQAEQLARLALSHADALHPCTVIPCICPFSITPHSLTSCSLEASSRCSTPSATASRFQIHQIHVRYMKAATWNSPTSSQLLDQKHGWGVCLEFMFRTLGSIDPAQICNCPKFCRTDCRRVLPAKHGHLRACDGPKPTDMRSISRSA